MIRHRFKVSSFGLIPADDFAKTALAEYRSGDIVAVNMVKSGTKKRTLSQNALYHMWLQILAKETGNDPEDIHEAFKSLYLSGKPVTVMGIEVLRRSTQDLTTIAMTEYMERVYAYARELFPDTHLPIPGEQHLEVRE